MWTSNGLTGRTVVLGLGNPLMGDDGLGLAALGDLGACCSFEPPVELIDGGTWGMNLLHIIEETDRLILLDAIDAGLAPGTPVVVEGYDLPRRLSGKLSPHQIDLAEVLAVATLRDRLPSCVAALGLQPLLIEPSTELTPPVRQALPQLVELAVERLTEWGHVPRRRRPAEPRRPTISAHAPSGSCTN